MPAITDRSKTEPLLKTVRLGHGTLECVDIVKTRRFYEEVLSLEVIQTSPLSLMIRKGTTHTYAVVETGKANKEMPMLNHNGLDVGSPGGPSAGGEDDPSLERHTTPGASHSIDEIVTRHADH